MLPSKVQLPGGHCGPDIQRAENGMRKVIVGVAFMLGALGISPGLQTASADIQDCATGYYCHYRDAYWYGGHINGTGNINQFSTYGFNDVTSSIIDDRAFRVFSYVDSFQGGSSICTSAYHFESNLADIGFNDRISSTAAGSTYSTCP